MNQVVVHDVKIPFALPLGPELTLERFVYAFLVESEQMCLIDTGVAGAEVRIAAVLETIGHTLADIDLIILSHAHPDHIGAAAVIQGESGAEVRAHEAEKLWIESPERQEAERPVPGFNQLVGAPVQVDATLEDGEVIALGESGHLTVLHTPGHSAGSISLWEENSRVLFSGDVIPQSGSLPIYEDVAALVHSLVRLAELDPVETLYSSWADPATGDAAADMILDGMRFVQRIHETVRRADADLGTPEPMILCRECVDRLNLPPYAVNPLVARAFAAHRDPGAQEAVAEVLSARLDRGSHG